MGSILGGWTVKGYVSTFSNFSCDHRSSWTLTCFIFGIRERCMGHAILFKNKNRSAEPESLSSLNLKLTDRQTQIHTPKYTQITSTCPYTYCYNFYAISNFILVITAMQSKLVKQLVSSYRMHRYSSVVIGDVALPCIVNINPCFLPLILNT